MNAQAGGFLATPPGLDGSPGLGIAGITGLARSGRWATVVTVVAPGIVGTELHFVTLADGTVIVDEDVADGAVAPLAEAVEQSVRSPYSAEAVRQDGDLWAVAANPVLIAELPAALVGGTVEQVAYEGGTTCTIDGAPCGPFPQLDELGRTRGRDYTLRAERLDEITWVVLVEPL